MVKMRIIWVLCFHLIIPYYCFGHFGAKYEPPDGRVIHGLGQYVAFFYTNQENWQLVSEYQNGISEIPVSYSVYAFIDPFVDSLDDTNFDDIANGHGYPYVLTVGVGLMDASYLVTGNINIPVQNILNGSLDYRIIDIAQSIKAINAPVYLRPGFEFGENNSGIHNDPDMSSTDFINIWIRIYNIFEQENVTNVAWVWNTVNPNQFNYLDWYPGDNYVDWWGINYFTAGQISSGENFLNDAALHGKPVMICESNPIQNGGTTNSANWNNWFVPYFNKIKTTPHIKAFIYISDPWDKPGFFDDWPDSRITSNDTIRQNYAQEMLDTIYIHMPEYQANPGIIGWSINVQPVNNFTAQGGDQEVFLSWRNPTFPGFEGVQVNRSTLEFPQDPNHGLVVYSGIDSSFLDTDVINDTTYYYAAFAYDSVPNYSDPEFASATPQTTTGIWHNKSNSANDLLTLRNFPNPFNAATQVSWSLPSRAFVSLEVFTVNGEKTQSLFNGVLEPGQHVIHWEPQGLPSGIYFVRLVIEGLQFNKSLQSPEPDVLSPGERRHEVAKVFLLK